MGCGINLAFFSRCAQAVRLAIFLPGYPDPAAEFPLEPAIHRTGYIWHACVRGLEPGTEYAYCIKGPDCGSVRLHRFDTIKTIGRPA